MRNAITTAAVWGGGGLLGGAATAGLLALPFYPHDDPTGWAELGWILATMAAAALLGLVAGTVALHRGLRRSGAAAAGRTAVVFVPLAVALAVVTSGVGALAAAPLARWVVERWWSPAPQPVGWGPPAERSAP